MAIVFTTGTINQPDSGSVGLAMIERLRDDLVSHAAWDLVEEFTPAAGTVRWYVFKCLAAQSGLPNDFYVVMGRTLATGEIRMFICETYNAAAHIATNWAPGTYQTQFTYDATGRHTVDYTLGSAPVAGTAAAPQYNSWVPSGTSTKWWITVAEDGFTVAFNGPSNGFIHCGQYIPLTQLPILLPVCMCGSTGNSSSMGMITRNPALANITTYSAGLLFQGGAGAAGSASFALGFNGDLRYNDKLQGGQRPVAEVMMQIQSNAAGEQAIYGWALGKHKRIRQANTVPAGLAFGDAYVLNGSLWVPYKPDDTRMWNTGVASS